MAKEKSIWDLLRTNLIIDPANSLSLKRYLTWLISIFVVEKKKMNATSLQKKDIKKLRNWKILPCFFPLFSLRVKFNYLRISAFLFYLAIVWRFKHYWFSQLNCLFFSHNITTQIHQSLRAYLKNIWKISLKLFQKSVNKSVKFSSCIKVQRIVSTSKLLFWCIISTNDIKFQLFSLPQFQLLF
jgi:hypothetical protein